MNSGIFARAVVALLKLHCVHEVFGAPFAMASALLRCDLQRGDAKAELLVGLRCKLTTRKNAKKLPEELMARFQPTRVATSDKVPQLRQTMEVLSEWDPKRTSFMMQRHLEHLQRTKYRIP